MKKPLNKDENYKEFVNSYKAIHVYDLSEEQLRGMLSFCKGGALCAKEELERRGLMI